MQSLPNFDQLVHLAATDPQQFTLLRQRLIEQTINQASPAMQPRLRAQQSHIDRLISHAKNPLHTNILLQQELQRQLQRFSQVLQSQSPQQQAKILPLK
ncbi:DUF3135 domain-containing protein [Photobacterium kishitanii]|uniref:DUF3135 domain-containing protein n=1 Tax=Photobacterium kishitanii TaxID=318456 RepID=A0A0B7J7F1_9GAMM|nr:DUF3135 domain-containing protein [Photobacterium kishitanii]OBU19445.1 hypothetical protein AYY22_11035 [Photobacterium kishitanii]PSU91049.1 DUF3135 domain-containing protein [Photobacterium kishitanii]PSU94950.1 DUF3135 domain-containing protein [Photobacterium kishitanii]PSU98719.1 DUF3135 domain-containing protein [Photobacterium kishitanii]PSV19829.1 DUF3135 domain-containing protein [Photobacterium kishitanii]